MWRMANEDSSSAIDSEQRVESSVLDGVMAAG